MKSARVFLFAAAAAVLIAVIVLRGRGPQKSTKPAPTTVVSNVSAPVPAAPVAETAKPKPVEADIVLLEEGSQEPASNRPRPTSQRMPTLTGSKKIVNARPVTSKEDGEFVAPRWSPDGLELLMSRPGYNGLFTVGADGSSVRQVTTREGVGWGADWTETGDIEVRTFNGEKQRLGSDGAPTDSVAVEEDASRVGTYTKDDTVYYRPAPNEAAIPVTSGEDRYHGGVVSPDGKYIAYNGLQTGIHVQALDGSSPPVSLGAGVSPKWLPDGSGVVYYIATDDGHNLVTGDLYAASVDGQTISNLTQTDGIIEQNPSVSPDGTRVAYEADGVVYVGELQ